MPPKRFTIVPAICLLLAMLTAKSGNCEPLEAVIPETLAPPQHFEVDRRESTNITLRWEPPLRSGTDLQLIGYAVAFNRTDKLKQAGYCHLVHWRYLGADQCTRVETGLQPATEYHFYLSAYTIKNKVYLLSPSVVLTVSTTSGGMQLMTIIFPLGIICLVAIVGTAVYANVRRKRRSSTSETPINY